MRTVKYPLPTVTNPVDRVCIQFEIPNEPGHRQAFLGAMWSLTRWYNWEKDETKRAKPVADVWNTIFYQVVDALVGNCESGERMIELRAVPGIGSTALNWKYTDEDESEWRFLATIYDGADGADGADGVDGRTVELRAVPGIGSTALNWKYTDEDESEWRFLATIYDGSDGVDVGADIPPDPTDNTICTIAYGVADRFLEAYTHALEHLRDDIWATQGAWAYGYINAGNGFQSSDLTGLKAWANSFTTLFLDSEVSTILSQLLEAGNTIEIFREFYCGWGTTKGVDAGKRNTISGWLSINQNIDAELRANIGLFLSIYPTRQLKEFAIAASFLDSEVDCTGVECEWSHTFNFATSDGGWTSYPQMGVTGFPSGRGAASWLSGSGWNATKTINSTNNYADIAGIIRKTFVNTYVTSVTMVYDDNPVSATRWSDGVSTGTITVVSQTTGFGSNLSKTVNINAWTTQLVAWVWVVGGGGSPSGITGTGKIKSITVNGRGENPFT